MFVQTFVPGDLATVAFLVVLEGVMSIDNALVLGILARRVSPAQRRKALSCGLIGALLFRLIAITAASFLLRWSWLKLAGGGYLLWVALQHLFSKAAPVVHPTGKPTHRFWPTVLAIELTDIAFAVDSILAAVALVGPPPPQTPAGALHPKLWVILSGGMLGVILMRFAAALFGQLLDRFPRLTRSAYLLVLVIGLKLLIDFAANDPAHPRRVDFGDPDQWAMWIFWAAMLVCLAAGFVPQKPRDHLA